MWKMPWLLIFDYFSHMVCFPTNYMSTVGLSSHLLCFSIKTDNLEDMIDYQGSQWGCWVSRSSKHLILSLTQECSGIQFDNDGFHVLLSNVIWRLVPCCWGKLSNDWTCKSRIFCHHIPDPAQTSHIYSDFTLLLFFPYI